MVRLKRSDILSAADWGFCLVCGGTDGICKCIGVRSVVSDPVPKRIFTDFRQAAGAAGESVYHYCSVCFGVSIFDKDVPLLRCGCGHVFQHNFEQAPLAERDYSEFLNLEDLPKRALRKPRL